MAVLKLDRPRSRQHRRQPTLEVTRLRFDFASNMPECAVQACMLRSPARSGSATPIIIHHTTVGASITLLDTPHHTGPRASLCSTQRLTASATTTISSSPRATNQPPLFIHLPLLPSFRADQRHQYWLQPHTVEPSGNIKHSLRCQHRTTTIKGPVRLRLGLRNPCPSLCRSRTCNNHRLLRHSKTHLHTHSTMALLLHTVPVSTSDHTRNHLQRKG